MLIKSVTQSCTQVVGPYWVSSPVHLTVLAAKPEDHTTVPQHLLSLQTLFSDEHVNCKAGRKSLEELGVDPAQS